ncbi:polysaccharide deacetylase family protein [Sulfurimonas sp.]
MFAQDKSENHAILLQYHRFGESRYPSTDISMKRFTQQMEYLYKNHYTVLPLSKIVNILRKKGKLPPKTIVITIDDAYKTVYTKAFPIFKKYNFPATIFVNSMPIIHHSKRYMTWSEMREMGKYGSEFANHTYSHEYLARIDADNPEKYKKDVTKEIVKSEDKIEKELGNYVSTSPKMLAYPFGEFDVRLMQLLKKMGYVGIAQNSGPISSGSNFLALTRFPMSANFGKMRSFILKIHTLPLDVVSTSTEDTVVKSKNNPPIFTIKLGKRYKDLQCFTSNGKKIPMTWLSPTEVAMQSTVKLKYPRDHYTCTAMASKGKWYWFSHMWVVLQDK